MSSPTLIDDSNSIVQYQSGWNWEPNVSPEVDHTRHSVSAPQVTASLAFTGTGIQVIGTLEPTAQSGQPTTQYAIDGKVLSTYTAPFTPSGSPSYNVTFFSTGSLSQGSHEIVITNMDGTSPNTFYLDYFLVYPDSSPPPTASIPPPALAKPETSRSLSPTVISPSSPSLSPSSSSTSPSVTTTPSGPVSASSSSSSSSSSPSSSSSSSSATTAEPSSANHSSSSAPTALAISYSTPSDTASSSSSTSVSNTTPSSIPADASHSSSSSSTGVIVGGVIGGLVVVALLIISLAICRRNRRRAIEDIQPFMASAQDSASSRRTMPFGAGGSPPRSADMASRSSVSVSRQLGRAPSSGASSVAITQSGESTRARSSISVGRSVSPDGQYFSSGSTKLLGDRSANHAIGAPDGSRVVTPLSSSGFFSPRASLLQHANSEASNAPWYAPPERVSLARQVLRALSRRRGEDASETESSRGVDSGLRLYNEPTLPPPYTPD